MKHTLRYCNCVFFEFAKMKIFLHCLDCFRLIISNLKDVNGTIFGRSLCFSDMKFHSLAFYSIYILNYSAHIHFLQRKVLYCKKSNVLQIVIA